MSSFVISNKYPCFADELSKMGHNVIYSDTVKAFPQPEQAHADMQILTINNTVFVLQECEKLKTLPYKENLIICKNKAGKKYPENILLNFLFFNNKLYGKVSAIDPTLYKYCVKNDIEIVNINQGYARCSTLILNNRTAVTADISIKNALEKDGAEVLLISSGDIKLEGYDYGFIGGASGKISDNTVVFFGNAEMHPCYSSIKELCLKNKIEIKNEQIKFNKQLIFDEFSDKNKVKVITTQPYRGYILDRNGKFFLRFYFCKRI